MGGREVRYFYYSLSRTPLSRTSSGFLCEFEKEDTFQITSRFLANSYFFYVINLVTRVLRLLGQRVVAGRDSGVMEL